MPFTRRTCAKQPESLIVKRKHWFNKSRHRDIIRSTQLLHIAITAVMVDKDIKFLVLAQIVLNIKNNVYVCRTPYINQF